MAWSSTVRSFSALLGVCLLVTCTPAPSEATPQAGAVAGSFTIAGTVVSRVDGHPLARARVNVRMVSNAKNVWSMVTSEDGRFVFNGLPAGKYSLFGAKRGFIPSGYDEHEQFSTAIVTGTNLDTGNLVLRLPPVAVISGKIVDETGEPVRNAVVRLYRYDHNQGVGQVRGVRATQTDDQGSYEMAPLIPGTYFLSATATPWYAVHPSSQPGEQNNNAVTAVDRTLDVAYLMTYYGDVTDPDSATPIPVRGGDRLEADIHLSPVPALRLLFHVPGDGSGGFTFPQLQQSSLDGSEPVQVAGSQMISPGIMEVTGIPAGRYDVRIIGNASGGQMNGVDLSTDGQEVDTSVAQALSNVTLTVSVPEKEKVTPQIGVALRSGRRVVVGQMVNAKGEVVFQQIAPGQYDIMAWGLSKPYSIAHISAAGAKVSGHTLTVTAGASPAVSLTLVAGTTEIQGVVHRGGKPFAGAMVVLVPGNPDADHDLFRRDQSDQDGTFSLRGVIPGAYTVLAIENGWELDWSQPGVLAAYMKHGQPIAVGSQSVRLPGPIEVQSK
jgi:carboxypeptidase family protein